ncbi:8184_t:CDS:2, partial [Entrophospora sp. SA101]
YEWMLKIPELSDESNKFISKVEEMIKAGNETQAYKYCLKEHMDSQSYSCLYKITKIYSDFLYETLDGNDMLGKDYTECDIIIKTFSYVIKALEKKQPINQKWGESFCPTSISSKHIKGRRCDVRFISPSGTDLGEWEFAVYSFPTKANKIRISFIQVAGTDGQMLLELLVHRFYLNVYSEMSKLINELEVTYYKFNHIFDSYQLIVPTHCKINQLHEP